MAGRRFGWGFNDNSATSESASNDGSGVTTSTAAKGGSSSGNNKLKCDELAFPVPCDDGRCHTDYISCLRSLSDKAHELSAALLAGQQQQHRTGDGDGNVEGEGSDGSDRSKQRRHPTWHEALAAAMRDGAGSFDEHGMNEPEGGGSGGSGEAGIP